MNIYMIELLVVIGIALLVDFKNERQRKTYIVICAVVLGLILFMRDATVGSDLGRYRVHFYNCGRNTLGYLFQEYDDNYGFYLYNFVMYRLLGGRFQAFVTITALLTFIPPMWLIKTYSKDPYLSFISYICMGFYIFQFSGLKQALAMAALCFAFHFVIRRKAFKFYLLVLIAMSIHLPAAIFLPVYLISRRGFKKSDVVYDLAIGGVIWLFRDLIAEKMSEEYDTVIEEQMMSGVGGKVLIIAVITAFGILVKGIDEEDFFYGVLLHCMFISAIIQFFAAYGNVFERLADYYFFYVVLFLPCVMSEQPQQRNSGKALLRIVHGEGVWYRVGISLAMAIFWYTYIAKTPGTLPYNTWL